MLQVHLLEDREPPVREAAFAAIEQMQRHAGALSVELELYSHTLLCRLNVRHGQRLKAAPWSQLKVQFLKETFARKRRS